VEVPPKLLEGCSDETERAARLGRFAVLGELGFFGIKTTIDLSIEPHPPGTFIGSVRKRFSNTYGDLGGCTKGDIEVTMELLDVMDIILDAELKKK